MKELSQIRKSIFDHIDNKITGVSYYHNGRSVFLNAETDLPAICVFIEDVQTEEMDLDGMYFDGELAVQVYVKSSLPESSLDELVEKVINKLNNYESDVLDRFSLSSVTYSNDENHTEWIVGTILYKIGFYRNGA
ncbi:phage tail terminator protein [Lonepinella sp. MS14436]|uniref:phage tail terminator protein n=1 Tax=Lonepinella sp. MS14436 TaxID=3003619 RepID=UPI0036DCAEA7